MLVVEFAKFGNLRDYLRQKRPAGHALSGSYESPTDQDHDPHEPTMGEDLDDQTFSLTNRTLFQFCFEIASGMEYLHSKKVNESIKSLGMIFNK